MYQRFIKLDASSYIEISTRHADTKEKIMLALRGSDNENSPTIVSLFVNPAEVEFLIRALQEAKSKISGEQDV